MIAAIYGKIEEVFPGEVYINTSSGIVYLINISLNTFKKIKDLKEVRLHTEYVLSESSQKLYGFFDAEEMTLFRTLNKVPKVGNSTSLSICGEFSLKDLYQIVTDKDVKALSNIKGLGVKSATNIISYLKDNKIITSIESDVLEESTLIKNIKLALLALGLKESQFKESLTKCNKELTLEENVKIIIKGL